MSVRVTAAGRGVLTIINMYDYIEKAIEEHNQRVYKGKMPVHNREVLRNMLEREAKFWEAEAVRVDNHNAHDDY
jgi:4-hydroxy-3-methylbut-2-enyl diphosphate reductase IspH